MTKTRLTAGAGFLKRGDVSDREDWRMTHRLEVGRELLRKLGYTLTTAHVEAVGKVGASREVPVEPSELQIHYKFRCNYRCVSTWANGSGDEPTHEEFNATMALADAVQNAKGARTVKATNAYHEEKAARRRAATTTEVWE